MYLILHWPVLIKKILGVQTLADFMSSWNA